jgi:hypothetical protein
MSETRPSLAILTHWTDDFRVAGALVKLMIPRWEAVGFRVVVVTDKDPFVPADVALLHVDLSVIPDSCRRLAERYPVVLNGRVLDIRKRAFSRLVLERTEPYDGEVIVKTDWNCGGGRELRRGILESRMGPVLRRLKIEESVYRKMKKLEALRPLQRRRVVSVGHYPVFPDRSAVPEGVWDNPNLVVERFVPERIGSDYCCRSWVFFGSAGVTRRVIAPHAVARANARLEETCDPIPEELRAIRAQMGFDYGKFDYGIVDGKAVLYDVNRTPGMALYEPYCGRYGPMAEVLSEGLRGVKTWLTANKNAIPLEDVAAGA